MQISREFVIGPIISEVKPTDVILWLRTPGYTQMSVTLLDENKNIIQSLITETTKDDDFTSSTVIKDLIPATRYYYKISNIDKYHTFKTAPALNRSPPLKIAWSGDVSGQNVCRDFKEGFPIFKTLEKEKLDLFIGLGDMIYADSICKKVGRYGNRQVEGDFDKSHNLENFWKHWRYNRTDENFKALMSNTPYLAVWDDHEVINDFGPELDKGKQLPYDKNTHLMPIGLKAFIDYNPTSQKTLYRKFSWGSTVDIFVLDTRQYRSSNSLPDTSHNNKTMLGKKQLAWFMSSILKSKSQFKIIISSVPLSIPTGYPVKGDGWANFNTPRGYENELSTIINFLHKHNINDTIWLTTDVHFAEVFHYTPFRDDPKFGLYEIAVGPLNAGLFPNKEFDNTLGPRRLFYYGANSFYDIKTYKDAKKWWNFGVLNFDGKGKLNLKIKNTSGKLVYSLDILSKN